MSSRPLHFDVCQSFVDQANKYSAVPFLVLSILAIVVALVVLPLVTLLPLSRVPVIGKIQAFIVTLIRFFDLRLGVVNVGSVGAAAGSRNAYAALDEDKQSSSADATAAANDVDGFSQYGLGIESSRTVGGVLTLLFALFSFIFYLFLTNHYNSIINAQFTEQRREVLGAYPNTTKYQFEIYYRCPTGSQFNCDTSNANAIMHAMQRFPENPQQPWDIVDVPLRKTCEIVKYHDLDICHATFITDAGLDKLNNIDHAYHWLEAHVSNYAALDAASQDHVFFGIKDLTIPLNSDLDPIVFSRSCRHWPMPAGQPNWVYLQASLRAKCMGRGFGTMHFCDMHNRAYDFAERSEPAQAGKDKNEIRIFMSLSGHTTATLITQKDHVTIGTFLAAFVTILIVLHPYVKRTICDVFAAILNRWTYGKAISVRQAVQLIIMATFYVAFFSFLGVHQLTELLQSEVSLPTYQIDGANNWQRLFGTRIAVTILATIFDALFLIGFALFAFLFLARSSAGKFNVSNDATVATVNAFPPAPAVGDVSAPAGYDEQ